MRLEAALDALYRYPRKVQPDCGSWINTTSQSIITWEYQPLFRHRNPSVLSSRVHFLWVWLLQHSKMHQPSKFKSWDFNNANKNNSSRIISCIGTLISVTLSPSVWATSWFHMRNICLTLTQIKNLLLVFFSPYSILWALHKCRIIFQKSNISPRVYCQSADNWTEGGKSQKMCH